MQHFVECASREDAEKAYPAAIRIVKVKGGYIAFDYVPDYVIWVNQQ